MQDDMSTIDSIVEVIERLAALAGGTVERKRVERKRVERERAEGSAESKDRHGKVAESVVLRVTLPSGSAKQVHPPVAHSLKASTLPDGHRRQVLHVEDMDRAGDLLRYYLRKDFDVTTVRNGVEALNALLSQRFDAILTDVDLGQPPNGIELIELVRKLPNYATTPIVAISGHVERPEIDRCYKAGANAYLTKPFLKADLYRVLLPLVQGEARA